MHRSGVKSPNAAWEMVVHAAYVVAGICVVAAYGLAILPARWLRLAMVPAPSAEEWPTIAPIEATQHESRGHKQTIWVGRNMWQHDGNGTWTCAVRRRPDGHSEYRPNPLPVYIPGHDLA